METNNRIREEWRKEGSVIADYHDEIESAPLDDIAEWWLSKIDELLKSQREELVEKIKDFEKQVKCPYNCHPSNCSHYETAIANIRILSNNLSPNKENKNNEN